MGTFPENWGQNWSTSLYINAICIKKFDNEKKKIMVLG